MFARTLGLLSRRSPISQTLPAFSRLVHSYVASDECILKPGEVYSFTDTGVRYIDLVKGEGEQCKKGDVIHIHHKGRILNNNRPIPDNSYQIGVPLSLRIGVGMVMPAWDEGILGMRVGGKRKIVCTPDKAFGEKGTNNIPPYATLIYEITLEAMGMEYLERLEKYICFLQTQQDTKVS